MRLFEVLMSRRCARLIEDVELGSPQQGQLAPLDGQRVFNALGGNHLLAAHGIDVDQEASELQCIEASWNGGDLIAIACNFLLFEYQAQIGSKGADPLTTCADDPLPSASPYMFLSSTANRTSKAAMMLLTHRRNTASKRFGSSRRKTRSKASCEAMPFLCTRRWRSKTPFRRPHGGLFRRRCQHSTP